MADTKEGNMKKILIAIVLLVLLGIAISVLIKYARKAEAIDLDKTAWLTGTKIVHRGLHDDNHNIAENSIPAFEAAIEKGYIIELDVSITKDKKLVVFHDKKLKRAFGIDDYLEDLTYEELLEHNLFNTDEKIPLFSEVLSFVNGRVPLLIEIKNEGEVGEMESLVYEELKKYKGQFAIQAFNPFTLKWFRDNAPEVIRGQLSGSFIITDYEAEYAGTTRLPWYKKFILRNMLLNFLSKPNFISYEVNRTSDKRLNGLKKLDVPVLGWVITDETENNPAIDKYDNLIFEPTYLK